MVQLRELIGGVNRNFLHPFSRFGEKAVLQTKELLGLVSVSDVLWATNPYQILPIFTKSV